MFPLLPLAHRLVLSVLSERFAAMFAPPRKTGESVGFVDGSASTLSFAEASSSEVVVPHRSYACFEALLE